MLLCTSWAEQGGDSTSCAWGPWGALLGLGVPAPCWSCSLLCPSEEPWDTKVSTGGAGHTANPWQHPLSKGKGKKLQKNLFVLQLWLKEKNYLV